MCAGSGSAAWTALAGRHRLDGTGWTGPSGLGAWDGAAWDGAA
jgi:hypothetical protein